MTNLVLGAILVTVSLSACAQLAMKIGVERPRIELAMQSGVGDSLIAFATSPLILLGLAIYGLSVIMWLWVLSKVDLSIAYPFVGLSFVVTMCFGAIVLNESVTPARMLGTLLIVIGCVLIGRTA